MRTLVTGFLGFGRFATNPSAELARTCGRPHELIEVSYAAADAFVSRVDLVGIDQVVLMGVAGGSQTFRLERVARNTIGPTPDIRGHVPDRPAIDSTAAGTLTTTLWQAGHADSSLMHWSDDAGDYLCNYLYFRMLQRHGDKRIGFLHVPPTEHVELAEQHGHLRRLLEIVETDPAPQTAAVPTPDRSPTRGRDFATRRLAESRGIG